MNTYYGRGKGRGSAGGGRGGSRGQGSGLGRNNGTQKAGTGGDCVCPSCGHKAQHVVSKPCYNEKCPKCGTLMTRE